MFTSTTTDYHRWNFSHHHLPDTTTMASHTDHKQADHERSSNVTTMQPHIGVRPLHYAKSAGATAWSGARKNGQERRASAEVSTALRPRSTAISLRLECAEVRLSLKEKVTEECCSGIIYITYFHTLCAAGATSGGPHSWG